MGVTAGRRGYFPTYPSTTGDPDMQHTVLGLHHVTATVADAQTDLDFCRGAMGLRLVKKTVNFDNRRVYHFYYGDERGTPGTIWTTFPYRDEGVAPGQFGAGQISTTAFSVPPGSLDRWRARLTGRSGKLEQTAGRFGEPTLRFTDPSGLVFEAVESPSDSRVAWTGGDLGPETAIRGLHSVTLLVRDPGPTAGLLTDLLGFRQVDETAGAIRLAAGGDSPGHLVDILAAPDAPPARNGLGTVHHVAFAVSDGEEQGRLGAELLRQGFKVTDVMDRQYFQSVYFREPGETVDETLPCLGQDLKLP
ncbi:MAG TPA: VOC family protein, partial [Gemmatimonadales bacterium]|nr:VOC family protein [Gemmatimonadales bacterium]